MAQRQQNITIDSSTLVLNVGTSVQLRAIPSTRTRWSSANPAVASITSGGVVTGVSVGATTITVRRGGASAELPVQVISAVPTEPPINRPPTVAIELESASDVRFAVVVDTAGTGDADNSLASYSMNWDDGSTDTAAGSPERFLSHTYAVGGTYQPTLTVTSEDGRTASASISVFVAAAPATPIAPVAQLAVTSAGEYTGAVELSTAGTLDVDGSIVSYAVTYGDGSSAGANTAPPATLTHTYAAEGTYQVALTVTDSSGLSSTASTQVTVTAVAAPPPATPPAVALTYVSGGDEGAALVFSTAGTSSGLTSYTMNWGDGSGVWEIPGDVPATLSHEYITAGSYTAILTVAKSGLIAIATRGVTITAPEPEPTTPPVARLTYVSGTTTGQAVMVSTSGTSTGLDNWEIDWADGTIDTAAGDIASTKTHTYNVAGTYTLTLTVVNADGSGVAQLTVVVTAPSPTNQPPVARIVQTSGSLAGDTFTFSTTGTDDPDDGIGHGVIEWGDGTTTPHGATPTASPSHTYATSGVKTVTYTVTDMAGAQSTTTLSVSVAAVPSSGQSPTGREPTLMWTAARQGVWNQMWSEYQATPAGPSNAIKTVALLKSLVDANSTTQMGNFPTMLYQMTGNTAYAQKAWDILTGVRAANVNFCTPTYRMFNFQSQTLIGGADFVREYSGELAIMYDWLYPGLTAAQRTTYKDYLVGMLRGNFSEQAAGWGTQRWLSAKSGSSVQVSGATYSGGTITITSTSHGLATGDVVLLSYAYPMQYGGLHQVTVTGANTFTFPLAPGASAPGVVSSLPTLGVHHPAMIGDSDQLVGMYFFLAIMQCLFPTDPYVAFLTNPVKFDTWGGLAEPTSYDPEALSGTLVQDMRKAIHFYTTRAAKGGEWIESSDYNKGTVRLVLMGAECTRTHYGVDYFPDVTEFQEECAKFLQHLSTPELNGNDWQWGDGLHARQTSGGQYTNTRGLVSGLQQATAAGARLNDLLQDEMDARGVSGFGSMEFESVGQCRHLYTWNPYATRTNRSTGPKGHWAEGKGILLNRGGFAPTDSLFAFGGLTRSYEVSVDHDVSMFGDVQLYKAGEWVITHPWAGMGGVGANNAGANAPVIGGIHTGSPISCKIGECTRPVHGEVGSDYAYASVVTGGSLAFNNSFYKPPPFCQEFNRSVLHVPGAVELVIVWDRNHTLDAQADIDGGQWFGFPDPVAEWNAKLGRVWNNWHIPNGAGSIVVSGGDLTYVTTGGQSAKIATLLPAAVTLTNHNESNTTDRGFGGISWTTYFGASEDGEGHVHVVPNSAADWQPFLTVCAVGAVGTISTINAANDYAGVRITRSGSADLVALFNATPGASLRAQTYGANRRAILLSAWKKTTTFGPVAWTAVGTSSDVFICQLDPARSWTRSVDGGAAQALTVSAQGIARITVSGAGAHTLTVTTT